MFITTNNRNRLIALVVLLGALKQAQGAPCCGGSSLMPSLITGDDVAQISLAVAHQWVTADVLVSGEKISRNPDEKELTQAVTLSGAYLLTEQWQVGLEVVAHRRDLDFASGRENSGGLGDTSGVVSYEFLPERSYSPWKPKGFGFLKLVAPTGTSVYEADNPSQIHGKGFWTLGTGIVLLKTFGSLDLLLGGDIHLSLARTIRNIKFGSGWGWSSLLGAGYSPAKGRFRFGLFLSPVYEGSKTVTSFTTSNTESSLVWNTGASVSYLPGKEWTASLTYTNQNLIPGAKNTDLSQGITFSAQKRFEM